MGERGDRCPVGVVIGFEQGRGLGEHGNGEANERHDRHADLDAEGASSVLW